MVSSGQPGWAGTGRRGTAPHASALPSCASGPGTGTAGTELSGTCGRTQGWMKCPRRPRPVTRVLTQLPTCGPCGRCPGTAARCHAGWGWWGCGRTTARSGCHRVLGTHPMPTTPTSHSELRAQDGVGTSSATLQGTTAITATAVPLTPARTHQRSRGWGGTAAAARPGRCRVGSRPSPAAPGGTAALQPGTSSPVAARTARCQPRSHPAPALARTSTLP